MAEGEPRRDLAEGDSFAGYRIERRLGRGGMGIVYLAIEEALDRKVALKLINPEASSDEVFRQRFAHESKIAASIEHPNVVPIYSAGDHEGVPYIAMRYVSGSDLARRVAGGNRLEPAHAAALIAQVGNGLDAIHAAGLIHRDVKPANVLLSGVEGSEHAYITDFGVARNVAEASGLTKTGRFVGTIDYVAPEQISGGKVDARSDVYSLGCLLFKLLSGEVPFPKDDEVGRLYAHMHEPTPAPSQTVPMLPPALDDVVMRAMAKAPEDRYPSAGDLGRAAVAAVSGETLAPERTVATGAAAAGAATPGLGETAPLTGATAEGLRTEAQAETEAVPLSEEYPPLTRQLPPESEVDEHRQRRMALFGAGAVIIALIIGAVVAGGGGGGGDGGGQRATGQDGGGAGSQGGGGGSNVGQGGFAGGQSGTNPLSEAQLIARADAVCLQAQEAFLETSSQFPDGETTPDVDYSRILTGISARAVGSLEALEPPASVAIPYRGYLEAYRRVHQYDLDALAAAEEGNSAAYLAARQKRNDEQAIRFTLARQIGLQECSRSPD